MYDEQQQNRPSNQYDLCWLPLFYLSTFNILNQLLRVKLPVAPFSLFFLLTIVVSHWHKSLKQTFARLFGHTSFNWRSRRDVLTMFLFVTSILIVSAMFRFYGVGIQRNWLDYLDLLVVSPVAEELVGRCLVMNTLRKSLPEIGVLLVSTAFWMSCHNLVSTDPLATIAFSLVCGACYLRFSSYACCVYLHSFWNLVAVFKI
jgi:membrane protease YdiL (CAAX protease family)